MTDFLLLLDSLGFVDEERSLRQEDGPRQRSHSCVLIPQDSLPYFTVSHLRLPEPQGRGPRIYIPQEQVGPITRLGTAPKTHLCDQLIFKKVKPNYLFQKVNVYRANLQI
jgi:hypothetical protein